MIEQRTKETGLYKQHNLKCLFSEAEAQSLHTPYQCVLPGGAIPQPHTVVGSSSEEVQAITSEAQAVHSAIMGCVYWLKTGKQQ